MGRIQQQLFEHRREILCGIRCANADSNTNRNCNSDCNGDTDSDPKPNAHADPVHGKMFTNTKAAADTTSPSIVRARGLSLSR
jgi:hypothetical protein